MSVDARGKIANTLVFLYWKGLNTCRQWLKPANPQTALQGDVRAILGGLGRASRVIEGTSAYHVDAKAVAGPQQTFVSAFVKFLMNNVMKTTAQFETEHAAYTAHAAKSDFDDQAELLGLSDFDLTYKTSADVFVAGMQLYELARYGILRRNAVAGAFDRSPFDTAIATWVEAEILELVADIAAV